MALRPVRGEPGKFIDTVTNVEYDIRRVTQRLRGPAVAGDALYAQGPWVVVPFEFPENSRQAGVK